MCRLADAHSHDGVDYWSARWPDTLRYMDVVARKEVTQPLERMKLMCSGEKARLR